MLTSCAFCPPGQGERSARAAPPRGAMQPAQRRRTGSAITVGKANFDVIEGNMVRTKAGFRGGSRLLQTIMAAALLAPGAALAALEFNLQPPVTPIARQIIDLHSFIFWICVVIFVVVFGVMFYSIFKHRKSVGHEAEQFHENTTVEVVWTVIPFLILLFMAFPATKTILAMKDTVGARHDGQGHGLPVEVELRLPAGGHRLLLEPRHARRADREPRAQGRELPARGRQPAGGPGRHQDPAADHRRRRDPRLVGAGVRRQAGRDSRLRPRHLVQGREGRHVTAASAPSSAARSTASCRSSSR